MKNKTAFYFDSKALGREWNLDIKNQALSGTDSTLLQVYTSLKDINEKVVLLSTNFPSLIDGNDIFVVKNLIDAYDYCNSHSINFLVYIATNDQQQYELFSYAQTNKVKLIAWAQCTPRFPWLSAAWKSPGFYRLIAVSNIQRESLVHHPIFTKTLVITNFIDDSVISKNYNKSTEKSNIIIYIGALRPSKGFQHLALIWPQIHKLFPEVKLDVCGSPGLYSSDFKLGDQGIAEVGFEKQILLPLGGTRDSAKALNVNFLGSLPKNELYKKIKNSSLVVVNPNTRKNGSIETFCVSAVEAMAMGVPVIGGADGGLLEVVGHNIGGLLASNADELKSSICALLSKPELNTKLSNQGRLHVSQFFTKSMSINRWQSLLNEESLNENTITIPNSRNLNYYIKSGFRKVTPLFVIHQIRYLKRKLLNLE